MLGATHLQVAGGTAHASTSRRDGGQLLLDASPWSLRASSARDANTHSSGGQGGRCTSRPPCGERLPALIVWGRQRGGYSFTRFKLQTGSHFGEWHKVAEP